MNITNAFTEKLHNRLEGKNIFFSPLSIQLALGMTAVGARGATLRGLSESIGTWEYLGNESKVFSDLITEVNGEHKDYELVTANAVWCQAGMKCLDSFTKVVNEVYGGTFKEVDFTKEEASTTVNDWCNEHTKGKIQKIVDKFAGSTKMVLTNAIYFKGSWVKKFNKHATQDGDFHAVDGKKKVPMMNKTEEVGYFEDDDFEAVDIPYVGGVSMMVLLPKNELADVSRNLHKNYNSVVSRCADIEVDISLPKFKVETKYNLKSHLSALGAAVAFNDGCDLSGITKDCKLKIDEVVHKAFVDVSEEGTEAAAVTAVICATCCMMPKKTKIFNANRPFLFIIHNPNTKTILFSGQVSTLD